MKAFLLLVSVLSTLALAELPNPIIGLRYLQEREAQTYFGPVTQRNASVVFSTVAGRFTAETTPRGERPRVITLREDVQRFVIGSERGRLNAVVKTSAGFYTSRQREPGSQEWEEWVEIAKVAGSVSDMVVSGIYPNFEILYLRDGELRFAEDGREITESPGNSHLSVFRIGKTPQREPYLVHLNKDGLVTAAIEGKVTKFPNFLGVEKIEVGVNRDGRLELIALKQGKVYHAHQGADGDAKKFTDFKRFGNLEGVTHLSVKELEESGVAMLNPEGLHVVAIRQNEWRYLVFAPRTLTQEQINREEFGQPINRPWLTP